MFFKNLLAVGWGMDGRGATLETEDQARGDGGSDQAVIGKLREKGGVTVGLGGKHYFWMEWGWRKREGIKGDS